MALEADNMTLSAAIGATEHLTLRDLAAHVHGPLPIGGMNPLTLPLKELLASSGMLVFGHIWYVFFLMQPRAG